MNNKTFLYAFILITAISSVNAQPYVKVTGNLLRIKFNQQTINPADTVGGWQNDFQQEYQYYSWYSKHLTLQKTGYFFKHYNAYYSQMGQYSGIQIESASGQEKFHLPLYSGFCGTPNDPVYDYNEPVIFRVPRGAWIINGGLGNYFVSNEGAFYEFEYNAFNDSTLGLMLLSIIGEISDNAVGAFLDESREYVIYKMNTDDSPALDSNKAERLYFQDNAIPQRILSINDSIYAVQVYQDTVLRLYTLENNNFFYLKRIENAKIYERGSNWTFKNNKLYIAHRSIKTLDFNSGTISFENEKEIFGRLLYDQDFNYAINLTYDSLSIFDLNNEVYINSWELPGSTGDDCFIDSPYVYINMTTKRIGIMDADPNRDLTYKLSAYPNPFNPQTTIAFTLANAGKVELAVYDMLGRKITELLNEYRDKGSYEVKFNGADLASGIYFYTIRAGSFVKTEKLMLLK